ncbi:hypothetical protein [Vibrio sp. D431a]|uniref:hypothetical protein n=1 Tax=Vibrio sp. D431a TaxID=2837388 RepID=UPI00255489D0|nr:hypothetical protein [Vibrio sp. D431a]
MTIVGSIASNAINPTADIDVVYDCPPDALSTDVSNSTPCENTGLENRDRKESPIAFFKPYT